MNLKQKILTGMRPTGLLHLGHYVGALENWIKLQDDYECYFLISDYQALGDHVNEIEKIRKSVIDMVLDWMSVGLDPKKSVFIVQSYVPEHAELALLLSMIIPIAYIERNPTLKTEMNQLSKKDISLGFFNYPASQVADILLPKAHLVPVGEDQIPHIELTRQIARKFNKLYKDIFPIPEPLVGRISRLVGTDGKAKMSKSLGNCIYLSDSKETVEKKVMKMYTDPKRIHATSPGHVKNNPVFIYLDAFHKDIKQLEELKIKYKKGTIGDVEVKKILIKTLNDFLDPIRKRRIYYNAHPEKVKEAIVQGTLRAKDIARETMKEVRKAMKITNYEDVVIRATNL
ncbi:tryptophan--tRNA ligase [Candidatus Parcubacteria bacterium]|nr:tryptophan--tRNA ligase [Candidatus Parcubacteria bacterium]